MSAGSSEACSSGASVLEIARLAAIVGLEVSIRVYPGAGALRDTAHAALLARFRAVISNRFAWRTEVPVADVGDHRAWDAVIRSPDVIVGVEAETRLHDTQALLRRLALKERDGAVDRVVLVLADTRRNRSSVVAARDELEGRLPVPPRLFRKALRAGTDPGGSGYVLV